MGRMIAFIADFAFYENQLAFMRSLALRHPGLKALHEVITGLKRLIKQEQREYRRQYGEFFDMRTVDARILIEWISASGYKPNAWESGFMASLYEQGFQPTDKQRECLQRIYEKASGGGMYERRQRV